MEKWAGEEVADGSSNLESAVHECNFNWRLNDEMQDGRQLSFSPNSMELTYSSLIETPLK